MIVRIYSLSLVVFPFTAFLVEKLAQRKCIPESVSDQAMRAFVKFHLLYMISSNVLFLTE